MAAGSAGFGGTAGRPGGTRALLALVIGLGVLIVAGFTVVVATLIHRVVAPSPAVEARAAPGIAVPTDAGPAAAPIGAPAAVPAYVVAPPVRDLDLPAGAHVASVTATAGRLALLIEGGGADRLVLVDPRDGRVIATLRVGR